MGEAARAQFLFLAPRHRERAVDLTLAGEEKSDGPKQLLTGKMFPPPPFIIAVDACKSHVNRSATLKDSSFFDH